ncbi:hypothetical protein Tco_0129938, partial [Tanacetum coccineum]
MVWSGYTVLISGKTDSIKINNISGCLPGSTFVYIKVFKLDFSSAPLHSALVTIHPSSIMRKISWYARYASSFVLPKSSYSSSLTATILRLVISWLPYLLQPSLLDSSSLIKPSMIALFLKACSFSSLTIHNL